MLRHAMPRQVVGTGAEQVAVGGDRPRHQAGVVQPAHAQGHVEARFLEVDETIVGLHVHPQLRMALGEARQQRRQVARGEGQRRGEAQLAAQVVVGVEHRGFRLLQLL